MGGVTAYRVRFSGSPPIYSRGRMVRTTGFHPVEPSSILGGSTTEKSLPFERKILCLRKYASRCRNLHAIIGGIAIIVMVVRTVITVMVAKD